MKRAPRPAWTEADLKILHWEWGRCDLSVLSKRLGRSAAAIREKARLLGLGPLKRGTYSLAQIAAETGYDRGRIQTAARRAGVNLMRSPRSLKSKPGQFRRHYAIDQDSYDRILAELAKHPDGCRLWRTRLQDWGGYYRNGRPKPEACIECGSSEHPHHTRGRCVACAVGPSRIPREVWEGRDPPHCRTCGRTDRPHAAHGDCRRCYQRRGSSGRGGQHARQGLGNVPVPTLDDRDVGTSDREG